MAERWRLINTGLRSPAQNVALDRALLETRCAGEIPSTLRFSRHTAAVLLGGQHSAKQEVDLAYCCSRGIPVQRRITCASTSYSSEANVNWALYLHRRDIGNGGPLAAVRRLSHAVATAVSALGVEARYRAPDEIEVDGRQIGVAAAVCDNCAVLVEGWVHMAFSEETVAQVLRWPVPSDARGHVHDRMTGLKELLGRRADSGALRQNIKEAFESEFDVEFAEGDLTLSEQARYEAALRATAMPEWSSYFDGSAEYLPLLVGAQKCAGRSVRAAVIYDKSRARVHRVGFDASVPLKPRRTLADLEAALRAIPLDRLEQKIGWFFASRPVAMQGLTPADFASAVQAALKQPSLMLKG